MSISGYPVKAGDGEESGAKRTVESLEFCSRTPLRLCVPLEGVASTLILNFPATAGNLQKRAHLGIVGLLGRVNLVEFLLELSKGQRASIKFVKSRRFLAFNTHDVHVEYKNSVCWQRN